MRAPVLNVKRAQPIPAIVGAVKLNRILFAGTAAAEVADGGGDGTSLIARLPAGIGTGICPGLNAKLAGQPDTRWSVVASDTSTRLAGSPSSATAVSALTRTLKLRGLAPAAALGKFAGSEADSEAGTRGFATNESCTLTGVTHQSPEAVSCVSS